MLSGIENTRSNQRIFFPQSYGSPFNDTVEHISGLGLERLDFERCKVSEKVIYTIEGDWTPTSQQDEEARISTLAYALKKLGNPEDAAEFVRCLDSICAEGDALSRQTIARHYYGEIEKRPVNIVLKEMAILGMLLTPPEIDGERKTDLTPEDYFELCEALRARHRSRWVESERPSLFDLEVAAAQKMARGRSRSTMLRRDGYTHRLSDIEEPGDRDALYEHMEALEQYDEGGAVIEMSAHERTIACGRLDPEFTAEDLPAEARHLAGQLRRAYTDGFEINEIWEEINPQLEDILPMSGKTAEGGWFFSHANAEWQRFIREALESLLEDYCLDCHLSAMRHSPAYRRFYQTIREADDTKIIGQAMKEAYVAKESGELSLKHFTLLKTASTLQRERLMNARLSPQACKLIREVETASPAKLRHLSWAFYGTNKPSHPIHQLTSQERSRVWDALKARKHFFAERGFAVMAYLLAATGVLSAEAKALFEILRMALSYYRVSRLPQRPVFHRKHDRQVEVTVRRVHQEDRPRHRA